MTPIKRLAYLLHVLMQEGRVPADWLITLIELIVRSDQGDVERQAQVTSARALRLSEQLLGDEVNLLQRPLEPHYLAEERCRLEYREDAFLVQAGWVKDPPDGERERHVWRKTGVAKFTTAEALKQEGAGS
jgi:hypothetical protein